jgi:hypothetical protein
MKYKYTRRGQVKTAGVVSSIVEYFTDPALLKQTALGMAATYAAMRPGIAYLGDFLSKRRPLVAAPRIGKGWLPAGDELAASTTRRMIEGAATPLPAHSAPAYTYKGMGQRLGSFMNRGVQVGLPGSNRAQALINVKLAPVESLWPGEVAQGLGYGVLRQDGAARVPKIQELKAALAGLPGLIQGNRTFGYLDSALDSMLDGQASLAKAPTYDYGKTPGLLEQTVKHMLPTAAWGLFSGAPGSGAEHLLSLRAHGNAADRIRNTLEAVRRGKEVKKPSALWAVVGPLSYRRQIEAAAEQLAELKKGNHKEVKRLGRALVDTMHPTHYLHELGLQLSRRTATGTTAQIAKGPAAQARLPRKSLPRIGRRA